MSFFYSNTKREKQDGEDELKEEEEEEEKEEENKPDINKVDGPTIPMASFSLPCESRLSWFIVLLILIDLPVFLVLHPPIPQKNHEGK